MHVGIAAGLSGDGRNLLLESAPSAHAIEADEGQGKQRGNNDEELENFLKMAAEVSKEYPVVVSQFLENTKEIEFDAVAQNGEVVEYAISEHVEFAGVHSGDSIAVYPPQTLSAKVIYTIIDYTKRLAVGLNVKGLLNEKNKWYVEQIYKQFENIGYRICHHLINCADLGVPQKRERVFFT